MIRRQKKGGENSQSFFRFFFFRSLSLSFARSLLSLSKGPKAARSADGDPSSVLSPRATSPLSPPRCPAAPLPFLSIPIEWIRSSIEIPGQRCRRPKQKPKQAKAASSESGVFFSFPFLLYPFLFSDFLVTRSLSRSLPVISLSLIAICHYQIKSS